MKLLTKSEKKEIKDYIIKLRSVIHNHITDIPEDTTPEDFFWECLFAAFLDGELSHISINVLDFWEKLFLGIDENYVSGWCFSKEKFEDSIKELEKENKVN
jgi:hypothetical protein